MDDFTKIYKNAPMQHVELPKGLCWPVKYAVIRRFSNNNTFGMVRTNPRRLWAKRGKKRPHQGWDFYAPPNYGCYAISDGAIEAIRNWGAYGLQIILRFEYDWDEDGDKDVLYAAYCHLNKVHVKRGQRVRMGDRIGNCGDSGNAKGMVGTDAHLHFEIRQMAVPGRGLTGRLSPWKLFDEIPLKKVMVTDRSLLK